MSSEPPRWTLEISVDFEKLDMLDVVSETAIWQYMWYGESLFQIYNDADRSFYESINNCKEAIAGYRNRRQIRSTESASKKRNRRAQGT